MARRAAYRLSRCAVVCSAFGSLMTGMSGSRRTRIGSLGLPISATRL
jgi:hypothetical protein